MCDLFFYLKKLYDRHFYSEDQTDETVKEYLLIDSKKHLIFRKFVYKSASMLEGTALKTPKIWLIYLVTLSHVSL